MTEIDYCLVAIMSVATIRREWEVTKDICLYVSLGFYYYHGDIWSNQKRIKSIVFHLSIWRRNTRSWWMAICAREQPIVSNSFLLYLPVCFQCMDMKESANRLIDELWYYNNYQSCTNGKAVTWASVGRDFSIANPTIVYESQQMVWNLMLLIIHLQTFIKKYFQWIFVQTSIFFGHINSLLTGVVYGANDMV